MSYLSRISLPIRVAAVGALVMIILLTAILAGLTVTTTEHSRTRVLTWVTDKLDSSSKMIDAYDRTARQNATKLVEVFRAGFTQGLEYDRDTQTLTHGGRTFVDNTAEVDRFQFMTGSMGQLLARKDDGFVRVSTTRLKASGERDIGTALAKDHPAHAALMAGKTYTGPEVLFGKHYMVRYEPITEGKRVVGALCAGVDMMDFVRLLFETVNEIKLFETGGVYVIDLASADGHLIAHAKLQDKSLAEVASGGDLLAKVRATKEGVIKDAPATFTDAGHSDRFVAVKHNPTWNWAFVAELSDGESLAKDWEALRYTWATIGGAILVLAALQIVLARKMIAAPMRRLQQALKAVESGDLSRSFDTTRADEMGDLIRAVESMRKNMLNVISQITASANEIKVASSEVAQGNLDLSSRTEEAASSIEVTGHSISQLTTMVAQTASASQQANQLATSASVAAGRAGETVNRAVSRMQTIHASSKKISDIIAVIDGIAFQTNILALNAAVEAARAGEQGRGFAVVAGEVRTLAQRSAQAAREIKQLISTSVDEIDCGSKLVGEAGASMHEVVASVTRVASVISEIDSAAAKQRDEIGRVNQSAEQFGEMTRQNSALVEQSAAAADSLRHQAELLAEAIAIFKLAGEDAVESVAADANKVNTSHVSAADENEVDAAYASASA
ncbi:MAG TPA: methyl-accepting chemotaxis protein [Burkholderiaceae bacterium]|nr:methyl-accepting chemotaxis protein [Burkholderiaceae bacterium]